MLGSLLNWNGSEAVSTNQAAFGSKEFPDPIKTWVLFRFVTQWFRKLAGSR